LVQWIGLPFGDAVKLSYQELEILNNKTDITEVQTALFLYKGAHSRLIWDDNSVVTGIGQTQESLGSFGRMSNAIISKKAKDKARRTAKADKEEEKVAVDDE